MGDMEETCKNEDCEAFGEPVPHGEHAPGMTDLMVTPESLESEEEAAEKEDARTYPLFEAVMGSAGTGKTFLMKAREAARKDTVLCATTGIAAINLGGSTINSLLGYFDTKGLRDAYVDGWLQGRIRKLRDSGVRRYILDEMSMLDAGALDILVDALDQVNLGEDPRKQVGLTLVGDFCQLPPVKAEFAFKSRHWDRFDQNLTILREIRRQSDADFIEALQAARRGDGARALEYFRDRLETSKQEDFPGPTLLAKNDEVDRYNNLKLHDCPGGEVNLLNSRAGKQRGEWKQIPDRLNLKEGVVVMVLANRRYPQDEDGFRQAGYEYVNGDLGELVDLDTVGQFSYPLVKLYRTGEVRPIRPVTREFLEPTGALGVKKERFLITGSITYFPLRLAYATTTHKSQGLSLDRVQVSYGNHFFGSPGMLYVALSRARTAEGLRLVGSPEAFLLRCNSDPRVARFL